MNGKSTKRRTTTKAAPRRVTANTKPRTPAKPVNPRSKTAAQRRNTELGKSIKRGVRASTIKNRNRIKR